MPERYVEAIVKYLANRDYQPLTPRQVARRMGISQANYSAFREAVKLLRDSGRVVLGERNALMLPPIPKRLVGYFRANRKGFGFIIPETPNAHGDLFVPADAVAGAMNGDLVAARVRKRGKRAGQTLYAGQIVQIIQRGENRFVGELAEADGTWFVVPDGGKIFTPVVIRDMPAVGTKAGAKAGAAAGTKAGAKAGAAAGAKAGTKVGTKAGAKAGAKVGTKVVVEIVEYPTSPGSLPAGVITETLGPTGELEAEIAGVIRARGLVEEFDDDALAEARRGVDAFDAAAGDDGNGRQDITDATVVTIDPPDAKDFDDAISLARDRQGRLVLGVHIADVSHFVAADGPLDAAARRRGTSVYFPRRVVPMLPEIISNGVCSLQQGRRRYAKSVFITYDAGNQPARRASSRLAETVIRSDMRLTYADAQGICDGRDGAFPPEVVKLVRDLARLARRIEARRLGEGMIQLDLPDVELVFDAGGAVTDVTPAENCYTHTMIEMFMVEANEVVAETLNRTGQPCLRRIHPAPDPVAAKHLGSILRACGHRIPGDLTRQEMQRLIENVRGKPESHAVNLALLRTFQQAEYSPELVGHFALGSKHYCHFTSPIRRYPDLTIHRLVAEHCRGRGSGRPDRPPTDTAALRELGENCTAAARHAEAAENELRDVMLIRFLAGKVGESFAGVVTGVVNFGIFVQLRRYMIDGLVRLDDLGDDWWQVEPQYGQIKGQRTGRTFRIGDLIGVRIVRADPAQRRLDLVPAENNRQ